MTEDYETFIRETPKVQPIVELGKPREEVTISDAVDYILKTDFDPGSTTYEFPILDQQPLSYDALRRLSSCNKCEVSIVSVVEDDKWTSRVMTGGLNSCDSATLLPLHSIEASSIPDEPIVRLKSPRGYPIVDDEGKFTGQLWEVDIHNHPDESWEGPPYPGMTDVRNAATQAKTAILLSKHGLTIFGPMGGQLNLPDEVKQKVRPTTPLEFSKDRGAMYEVSWYMDRHNLFSPDDIKNNRTRWTLDKVICDVLGAKVKVLKWDEDRSEIERVLAAINDRTFDSSDYLAKNAEPPMPLPLR